MDFFTIHICWICLSPKSLAFGDYKNAVDFTYFNQFSKNPKQYSNFQSPNPKDKSLKAKPLQLQPCKNRISSHSYNSTVLTSE
jgi:hypothetical protein